FVIAGFTTGIVAAQKKSEGSMQCRESRENDRLSSHCEIKEQTLPAGGAISVDGKTNGGISIKGWERNEILVRAKIETRAPTQAGVNFSVTDKYSAHLETGTVNGNVSFGFPVNVSLTERGRMPKDVSVDLGAGGPTVRARTTNGGVRVGRLSGFE